MILKLFRKIFGCYSDRVPAFMYIDEPDDHVWFAGKGERDRIVAGIVGAVVAKKTEGFVSYVEDAMDGVTGNRYAFIKYRNTKKK